MQKLMEFYNRYVHTKQYLEVYQDNKTKIEAMLASAQCILFGAGGLCKLSIPYFHKLNVEILAIADNDPAKWGSRFCGITIIAPQEICHYQQAIVVIVCGGGGVHSIETQLCNIGITDYICYIALPTLYSRWFPDRLYADISELLIKEADDIAKAYQLLHDEKSKELFIKLLKFRLLFKTDNLKKSGDEQYFPEEFWKLDQDEIYVDLGSYDGDTLQRFLNHTEGQFNKYIAFEPDKLNYKKLITNIPSDYQNKIMAYPFGVGAKKEKVNFSAIAEGMSCVTDGGDEIIELVALDVFLSGKYISTIKMDIEGYEPEAIEGAKHIIATHTPKLAICVYHKPEHLWQIVLQIVSLNSNYRFYLRNHGLGIYETVIYCV